MLRRTRAMSVLVLLLIAGLAWAQPPKGPPGAPGMGGGRGGPGLGGPGFGGPGMGGPGMGGFGFGGPGGMQATLTSLVGIPEVQKELVLSDQQKQDVGDLMAEMQKQMRSSMAGINFQELQDMSEEERQKVFADARKKSEDANNKAEQKLGKILDEKQLGRLNQLRLQREGIAAFNRPEVAKQLGLSEDQIAKIRKIQEQGRPGFGAPGGPADQDPRDFMARMQKQREKVQADVLAALTDEQRTKWAEMKGKEFKFPQPQFGFGPGGPGGRGGPGFGAGKGAERTRPPIKKRDQ